MIETIKKHGSNILFVIAIGLMIYPPTRVWLIRQISFSPSMAEASEQVALSSYEWQLKGLNTDDVAFADLEGKVVFVNFWATWCPPCRAELPMIQALYDDYKDKVAFVFVTNEGWSTVRPFYEKGKYDLPTYNPLSYPPSSFTETKSIPATYLIDKSGKIVISKAGAADWNSASTRAIIDELLAE